MKSNLLPVFVMLLTIALGCLYAVYNIDPHHWGFILGTALDFISGKKLFSEVYVQYGAGEAYLFKFLSHFIPINITSIGVITSIVYGLNLLVLFFGMRKIGNAFIAGTVLALLFLLHSYAIYPWPDYYAGFFLSLACFFLMGDEKTVGKTFDWKKSAFSGVCLFVAFLFRNTYLLHIGAGGLAYTALSVFYPSIREKKIYVSMITFILLLGAYFLHLNLDGDFHLWYAEAIGAGSSQYGVGIHSIVAILKEAFFPSSTINAIFSLFFYAGFFSVFSFVFNKTKKSGFLIFFSLIGMAGVLQSALLYEMFRLQNACSPLFLVGVATLVEFFPKKEQFFEKKKLLFLLCWLFAFLLLRFPRATSYFSFFDGRFAYHESTIPIYHGHRFRDEQSEYYAQLSKLLCDGKSNIVNHTMDSSIPYLCEGQTHSFALPFYFPELIKTTNPEEIENQLKGIFNANDVIIADAELPAHPHIKLVEVGEMKRPELWCIPQTVVKVYRVERVSEHL